MIPLQIKITQPCVEEFRVEKKNCKAEIYHPDLGLAITLREKKGFSMALHNGQEFDLESFAI